MVLLRGNPGHKKINHDEPKPELLTESDRLAKCPAWLTGDARELWKRAAPRAIKSGLLTVLDLPMFEGMCKSYAKWRAFEKLAAKVGPAMAISQGLQSASVKERQLMVQFAARFGFDPSSRSNVKVAPTRPTSQVDNFRKAKTGA